MDKTSPRASVHSVCTRGGVLFHQKKKPETSWFIKKFQALLCFAPTYSRIISKISLRRGAERICKNMLFAPPQRVCVRIRIPLIGTALHLAFSQGTPPQVFSCRCHINSPSRKKKGLILFKVGQNLVQPLQDNFCYSQLMLFGIIADTLIQGILHPNAQGFLFCIFGFWSSHLCHSCSHTSTAPVYFLCDRKSSCKKPFLKIFTKNRKFTLCSLTFRP